jgi:4,5-DOPA dioxygenase extradiol
LLASFLRYADRQQSLPIAAQTTEATIMKRLPTLFLSHGSPMHAVQAGAAGEAWAALGRKLPRPRAVLIASAHWETSVPMLTGNPQPETIHDFGGFPPELYQLRYPTKGAPDLAERAVALLKDADLTAGIDGCRGLDHGAWVPLRWMYPDADIPVVQLSVQPELGPAHHVRLGRAVAPLAGEGVLIIGSGHTTHNLRDWMTNPRRQEPLRYAQAFAEWVGERLRTHDTDALTAYREQAPEASRAHPSEEHFLPLFVALGAAGNNAEPERILGGFEAGALAMDSYLLRQAA